MLPHDTGAIATRRSPGSIAYTAMAVDGNAILGSIFYNALPDWIGIPLATFAFVACICHVSRVAKRGWDLISPAFDDIDAKQDRLLTALEFSPGNLAYWAPQLAIVVVMWVMMAYLEIKEEQEQLRKY